MAIQPARFLLASTPDYGTSIATATLNAAGESYGIVGQVRIEGNATGKVISAAGSGKIVWVAGAVTFATAGTTFRVGIQDVDTTTGLEDGTFDVYMEYVQGTDTITASGYNVATMNSGTKTLSDGDLIAIVAEMPVRNGADSVIVGGNQPGTIISASALGFPYGTTDSASLTKTTATMLYALIQFDDGTIGWINGSSTVRSTNTSTSFNSGSVPDEYCATFTASWKIQISGISVQAGSIATTDAFEVILYSNPYVTPVVLSTVTPDQDVVGASSSTSFHLYHITPTTLVPGTVYGISLRPTTTNNIAIFYSDCGTTPAGIIRPTLPLTNAKIGTRTNQTGAFTSFGSQYIPIFALDVCGIEDGGDIGYLPVA